MIHYGNVFFSRIRNGAPQFISQPTNGTVNVTEETPNAILAGSAAVQETITTPQTSTSLANIVRMWEAPVTGDIRIVNEMTMLQNSQDGVDVWIEKGEMTKVNEDISGYNPAYSSLISSVVTMNTQGQFQGQSTTTHVEKGQRIFIIASSKTNQNGDRIRVDTNIRYNAVPGVSDIDQLDANDNYYFKYDARPYYLPSSIKENVVGDKSKVNISWNALNNQTFTDDVDFKIYKTIHSISNSTGTIPPPVTTLIYHHKLMKDSDLSSVDVSSNSIPGSDISNLLINQNPSDSVMTLLHFDVSADTNVSWEKIKWKPTLTIMSDTDTTAIKALVEYNPYSERLINTLPQDFRKYRDQRFCDIRIDCPRCNATTAYLFPNFNGNSTLNDYTVNLNQSHNTTVTFSLKIKDSNGKVYTAKNTVTGEVTNWYEYMPYGEMLMENTTMNYDHPYKFNGKELDMATGYYYYGARYYDPKRSFWLSVDPLADITISPYAYVWNDPVNFADPTGLMGERKGGKGLNDWYRDAFGNMTWHNSKEDKIVGKNGEILTRVGKSWSYMNNRGGVTTLNENRSVTQEGKTSFNIMPTPMSLNSLYKSDPWGATIGPPSPMRGKSKFDFIMVDSNPLMKEIAKRVCIPCGNVADAIEFAAERQTPVIGNKGSKVLSADKKVLTLIPAKGGGKNIALGVREHLDVFANKFKLSTYKTWGNINFEIQFNTEITNPANRIHFNLDGISNPWSAISEGAQGLEKSRVTSWELFKVYSDPAALRRTTFYRGGKAVANPFN